MDAKTFTPEIVEGGRYALALIELDECPTCKRRMAHGFDARRDHPFPRWEFASFPAQMKRADIAIPSGVRVDDEPICQDCAAAGKATILCYLCVERRQSGEEKESYGDPPEFLCRPCYQTVTAERWDAAEKELYARHRYDFE